MAAGIEGVWVDPLNVRYHLSMSPDSQLHVVHNPDRSRFEMVEQGLLAKADYRLREQTIVFTHTEVPPPLQGKGVGAAIVKTALDYSRQQGYHVVAACPFVAQYIRRHPDYSDLLK